MNDFNKLDKFMRQHTPQISKTLAQPQIPKAARSWVPALLATTAAVVLVLTLTLRPDNREEDTLASLQALDWEENTNDLPTDVADLVAIVD
jgi:hypothetical protein